MMVKHHPLKNKTPPLHLHTVEVAAEEVVVVMVEVRGKAVVEEEDWKYHHRS